jgi:lipopolysaccharide export system protein LptA
LYFHNDDKGTKKADTTPKSDSDVAVTGSGLYRYDAEGNVFATSPDETASGEKAIFEVDKQLITMTGNVILTRGKNTLRGSKLVIETATGRSRLDPDSNGRVKGLFVPEDKSEKAEKAAKPAGSAK